MTRLTGENHGFDQCILDLTNQSEAQQLWVPMAWSNCTLVKSMNFAGMQSSHFLHLIYWCLNNSLYSYIVQVFLESHAAKFMGLVFNYSIHVQHTIVLL